jgi:hypothetical protein
LCGFSPPHFGRPANAAAIRFIFPQTRVLLPVITIPSTGAAFFFYNHRVNILGDVRALTTKTVDVSDDVTDFPVVGYMILRGIAKDEYEANKTNFSKASIEYSAMATYGQGKKYRVKISPNYTGYYA